MTQHMSGQNATYVIYAWLQLQGVLCRALCWGMDTANVDTHFAHLRKTHSHSKTRSIKQKHFKNPSTMSRVSIRTSRFCVILCHPPDPRFESFLPKSQFFGHIKLQCSGWFRQNVQVYSKTLRIIDIPRFFVGG